MSDSRPKRKSTSTPVRALVIGGGPRRPISKAEEVAESNAQSAWERLSGSGKIVSPPFDPFVLTTLPESSADLGPTIEAMETNIVGFGWQLVASASIAHLVSPDIVTAGKNTQGTGADGKATEPPTAEEIALRLDILKEKEMYEEFLTYGNWEDESLDSCRRAQRRDHETLGYSFLELIQNSKAEIVGYRHVPAYQMRLGVLDEDPVSYNDPRVVGSGADRRMEVRKKRRRFRRYVQWDSVTGKVVYFKEFGDPRPISKLTGEVVAADSRDKATAMLFRRIYAPRTPYGVPRHIGTLLAILGARAAEEVNYTTFRNNNIPSMMILVSGGQLTADTITRITDFSKEVIQGDSNYSKFLILEAESDEAVDQSATGSVKIDVKPMTADQHTDAMFQNYEKNNSDKVRRAFRLPPIMTGGCHSADTEYLTDRGWLTFDNIPEIAEVATMNRATSAIEFQAPTARHRYDWTGPLLYLRNRGIDALVTPAHRFWTRPTVSAARASKPWQFASTADLPALMKTGNGGCVEIPTLGSWIGERVETFTLVKADQITEVAYGGGWVSCFTVPNETLITRRNGRVMVSGNSQDYTRSTADTSRRLSEEQVFAPERREEDWAFNRVLRAMGMRFWEFKTNSPNVTDDQDLLSLLYAAEKVGAMTPRIGREIVKDILGRDIPGFDEERVPSDTPFSLIMAEAVKNQAMPTEPGQQVTALKAEGVGSLLQFRDGLIRELRAKEKALRSGGVPGVFLRDGLGDRVATGAVRKFTTTEKAEVDGRTFALVDEVHIVGFARFAPPRADGDLWVYDVEAAEATSPYPHAGIDEGAVFIGTVGVL